MARQQEGLAARDCEVCGTSYLPYRSYQRACSRKCRNRLPVTNGAPHARSRDFICGICGDTFSKVTTSGRNRFCDTCQPQAVAARMERKNANRRVNANTTAKARNRAQLLQSRYQMTVEQHAAMVNAQGNRCAICGELPKPEGVRAASRLHVDHDHESGRVRGLLCNHCNRGLGAFRDRPDLLELAIVYLRSHS